MGKGEKPRSFALLSGKGGVGRSFLSVGLAKALSRRRTTLLFDLDPEVHTCDILLGLENEALFTLDDLIAGTKYDKVLLKGEGELYLCPAPSGEAFCSRENALDVMHDAARQIGADCLIFDAPARGRCASFASDAANEPFVVSCFDACSALAAEITAQRLSEAGKQPRLLLNRFSPDKERDCGAPELIDRTHARLLGVLPEKDLISSDELRILFDNLAARLENEDRPLFDGLPDAKKMRRMLL